MQINNGWQIPLGKKNTEINQYGRYSASVSGSMLCRLKSKFFLGPHFMYGSTKEYFGIEVFKQPKIGFVEQLFGNRYHYFKAGLDLGFMQPITKSETAGLFFNITLDFCKIPKDIYEVNYIYDWYDTNRDHHFSAMNFRIYSSGKITFSPSVSIGAYLRMKNRNYFSISSSFSFSTSRQYSNNFIYYTNIDPIYPGSFSEIYIPEFSRSAKSGPAEISFNISYLFSFFNKP